LQKRFITATITDNDRVYEASFALTGEFKILSVDGLKIDVDLNVVLAEMNRRVELELSGGWKSSDSGTSGEASQ
jgi:hypothetical protein